MEMLWEMMRSKKFVAMIVGLLVALLKKYIPGLDDASLMEVLTPVVAYILGQGIADFGKEAAKIEGSRQ